MASTSSLLRSAATAAAKQRDYEDALAAYEWTNSVKTYADYVAYDNYLSNRMNAAIDPGDKLSYQKKIDSARSGYISNEIQRQSINVVEGKISNPDKYNRMVQLYHWAADSGQNDLAQSLRGRIDSLSVTIQNEQLSSLVGNREALNEATKEIDNQVRDAIATIQDNAKFALEQYQELGPLEFEKQTGVDIFSLIANMINSPDPNNPGLIQVYDQAINATPDPAKQRDYALKFNDLANEGKSGIELPGIGAVSYKDLMDQAQAMSVGQTLFDSVQTAEGIKFTKNKTTGYAWGRDASGQYVLMPVLNPKSDFSSNVANPKKQGDNLSYDTLLKGAGFEVTKSGDSLIVRNSGQFDTAGIPRGQQVQLYVDASGNLQAVNGQNAYSLSFDQTGKYTGLSAQMPNPINMLPSGTQRYSRFNNPYFSNLDLTSLPAGAAGLVDTTSQYARPMEAGPLARPQPVVQQGQAGVPRPVAPSAAQRGAISPIGLPANTRINIAQPKPLPKITVAKPKPLPQVKVAPAKPQPKLSVGAPMVTPNISF